MSSSAYESSWEWPSDLPGRWSYEHNQDEQDAPKDNAASSPQQTPQATESAPKPSPQQQKHFPSRTCRICLETVLPTFEPPSENIPGVFQGPPKIVYSTPDLGRLISPCLCKGSQKYVHEGCLTAWRMQNPAAKRNYWECPSCRYRYRLERMKWGRWISSTGTLSMWFKSIAG